MKTRAEWDKEIEKAYFQLMRDMDKHGRDSAEYVNSDKVFNRLVSEGKRNGWYYTDKDTED